MLQQFQDHLARHQLCKTTDKMLLAVSGGLDSMAMLHLFLEAGFSVQVAHCNFQLRSRESDGDEDFVKQVCQKEKLPFHSRSFDTLSYARQEGLSIQMAARQLRYAWFQEVARQHNLDCIATAHHRNDTIETVLLHVIHGTDLEGLTGIPVRNGNVIRPLLFATREEIEAYAAEKDIAWREDLSNTSDHYERNFLRRNVMPLLKKVNPSLEATFGDTLEKMSGEAELVQAGITNFFQEFAETVSGKVTIAKRGIEKFRNQAPVLWVILKRFGFNLEQCRNMIDALHSQPGKRFLTATHQLVIDRSHLIITSLAETHENVQIESGQPAAAWGPLKITIERGDLIFAGNRKEAFLDASKIKFPLLWRRWEAGDVFVPLGMKGQKKVSDFLIDSKIPVSEKETVSVLESAGAIVWVVGYRLDDRFKVSDQTKSTLVLRLTDGYNGF